ncbi:hypothetical protein [Mycobacterium asiaticum]|uniref:Uncharacterized protein n=1 Tax=Mycobacterium asiaticum TaxID=1790 RepID=A0A1A3CW98_MYCAS|nr:hypothetical protein [Mycobacterium asiaticum]OBI91075.1 hypothetical protein A9X01_10770 [Mycobacterium asiaticum]
MSRVTAELGVYLVWRLGRFAGGILLAVGRADKSKMSGWAATTVEILDRLDADGGVHQRGTVVVALRLRLGPQGRVLHDGQRPARLSR